MKKLDLTGHRFGALTVICEGLPLNSGRPRWVCRCDCGNEYTARASHLRAGRTIRCLECATQSGTSKKRVHGGSSRAGSTQLYRCWKNVKQRCLNPSSPAYSYYGGRGVTMHPDWAEDFVKFAADVGAPPSAVHTLDRKDNNRGYEPGNTRWATRKEQSVNRRNVISANIGGVTKTLVEWCNEYNVKPGTVRQRVRAGISPKEAITMQPMRRSKYRGAS